MSGNANFSPAVANASDFGYLDDLEFSNYIAGLDYLAI